MMASILYSVNFIEGQADAVVRHPALGKIVGADALAAVAAAHLALPRPGNGGVLLGPLHLIEPGPQDLHGLILVLILAPLVLALHHKARGQVGDADGGLCLVHVLAAGAGSAVCVDLQVLGVNGELHLLRLRQHRHGGGAGVDPAGGLRLRHPLDPVDAAFKFQPGPGALTLNEDAALFHAAQLRFIEVHDIQFPVPGLGVHGVHPQKGVGKQRPLLAADATPQLHDHVSAVAGVFGQQQSLQLLLQPLRFLPGGGVFLLGQFPEIRVVEQALRRLPVRLRLLQSLPGRHHRLQLLQLPGNGFQPLTVPVHRRVAQLRLQVLVPQGDLL